MKLGIINSAWKGTHVGTAEGIRLIKEIGFDTIDIYDDPLEIDIKERKLIRDICTEVGLPIISVATTDLGLVDFNASARKFSLKRCKAYLDFAYELEAENLLLTIGQYLWDRTLLLPKIQWKWAVENFQELGEYAAHLGLEIANELAPYENAILNSVNKIVEFLKDVNHPAVKVNVDISHFDFSGAQPEDILKIKDKVIHAHISDHDGKHGTMLPPGRGVINFEPYLKALKSIGYDGTVSVELEHSHEPEKIVEWVKEAYTATNRIMQKLGIRG